MDYWCHTVPVFSERLARFVYSVRPRTLCISLWDAAAAPRPSGCVCVCDNKGRGPVPCDGTRAAPPSRNWSPWCILGSSV